MDENLVASQPFIEGRGEVFCRGCGGEILFSALDLGELPIANELLTSKQGEIEKFPLHLRICVACGLGQVADVVTPERIFRDYRYLSSISSTFLEHALTYVEERVKANLFNPGDWVLEIASNDGYLLRNFLKYDIKVIGIEPADNVAAISRALGIETISEFFSSQLASEIFQKHGYPKLIIANNVMAHVPDLVDFMRGLALLCGPNTQISVENPSLSNIFIEMQFDTIYHEHYSYLSAYTVAKLGKLHGLYLDNVERLAIHGGSNRYCLNKNTDENIPHSSVDSMIQAEIEMGLFDSNHWKEYSDKVADVLKGFLFWLRTTKSAGARIYGYGAAAKASTLLNSISVGSDLISAIADASLEKQGRFMPAAEIAVISPKALFAAQPSDVVIFPWNIKNEIAKYLRANLGNQTRLWCAIPHMHELENR